MVQIFHLGNPILGFGGTANTTDTEPSHINPSERVPYLTLAYANGPGGGSWFYRNYSVANNPIETGMIIYSQIDIIRLHSIHIVNR